MFGMRTWMVFADNNFLGYEYSDCETVVHEMSIKKFGEPEKWGVESYKIKLVPWPTDE